MEIISSPKSLYLRYELDQGEIQLQQNAIDSKLFSMDFKLVEYALETGDNELDLVAKQLAEALMDFGVNFDTDSSPHVETIVTVQYLSIQPNKNAKENRVTDIHHSVYLDELAAEKLVNICVTKTNLKLTLTLFLSIDSILALSSSLKRGTGLSLRTSNFALANLTP